MWFKCNKVFIRLTNGRESGLPITCFQFAFSSEVQRNHYQVTAEGNHRPGLEDLESLVIPIPTLFYSGIMGFVHPPEK